MLTLASPRPLWTLYCPVGAGARTPFVRVHLPTIALWDGRRTAGARLLLPETERVRRGRFDVAGAVLLGLGVTAVLLAVNRGAAWGWTSARVLAGFLLGPALLVLFLVVESRAEDPMVPLGWLRRRNLVAPIASQTLSNF